MEFRITETQYKNLMNKPIGKVFFQSQINEEDFEDEKHLPKEILDDIMDANPKFGGILKIMVEDGAKSALPKWERMVNDDEKLEIDFEDLLSLSNWIEGSKTNKNPSDVEVPDFVKEIARKLT